MIYVTAIHSNDAVKTDFVTVMCHKINAIVTAEIEYQCGLARHDDRIVTDK
ncbi:MAG: hypothetical protein PHQ03_07450 [Methylococcales bacterium]|nr:hypothetical protein [Methylococcales bacterium]